MPLTAASLYTNKTFIFRLLLQFSKRPDSNEKKRDITLDMLQPSRYKPNDLSQMAKETKFTKRKYSFIFCFSCSNYTVCLIKPFISGEVRSLYRAFKQECPNGIVDEDTFKDVYEKIFPLGDASHYAHLVFTSIDRERTGGITFGDFMEFLSIITKVKHCNAKLQRVIGLKETFIFTGICGR